MTDYNENRSLSPDSPIPEFPSSLVEYTTTWTTHESSSPDSSDSECSSLGLSFLIASPEDTLQPYLRVQDYNRLLSGSDLHDFANNSDGSKGCRSKGDLLLCEELPSRDQEEYEDYDDDLLAREVSEELGTLSSDSSEEEVLTTRVVRRRVIIQTTRKVIRKYVFADGVERQDVSMEGAGQEVVQVEEGDVFSRVVKRTVVRSHGDQKELTFLEPLGGASSSQFETEPVQGRKVSRVVKTKVVRGDRVEKHTGDSSLAADLPSAGDDFRKPLDKASALLESLLSVQI
ncbi:hypothetical protein CRUP_004136 [Coryphaenoides rupestris]|nr:hypothetical protein CRUP_004136 [Coryphaenoides rupestris]